MGVGSRKRYSGMKSSETIAQYKARNKMSENVNTTVEAKAINYVKRVNGKNIKLVNPNNINIEQYQMYSFEYSQNNNKLFGLIIFKGKSGRPNTYVSFKNIKSLKAGITYHARLLLNECSKYDIVKNLLKKHIRNIMLEAIDPKTLAKQYVTAKSGKTLKLANPKGLDTKYFHVYTFEFYVRDVTHYALLVFKGKRKKPDAYYSYRTEAQRTADIKMLSQSWFNHQKYYEEKTQIRDPLEVGDIVVNHWGYEQTNVNFYQVTKVNGLSVWIKPIESKETYSSADSMVGTSIPLKNKFTSGTEIRKKMYNVNNQTSIKMKYGSARKWDGKPVRFTSYY